METLLPRTDIGFARPAEPAKARAAAIRLECLKLVYDNEGIMPAGDVIDRANKLFDFVMDAPAKPELFVVKRASEVAGTPPDNTHLRICGDWVTWGFPSFAYRFRSEEEAADAMAKYAAQLFGDGVTPDFVIQPLPAHFELF